MAEQDALLQAQPPPPGTPVPQLVSSLAAPSPATLVWRESPHFTTKEWELYDLSVHQRALIKQSEQNNYHVQDLLHGLTSAGCLNTMSRVDLYILLRWHAGAGKVDLSRVDIEVWRLVLADIVDLNNLSLLKLFLCDIDPSASTWLFENNEGLSPIELMDKLRLLRKKRRPQTPEPTLTSVDLIQALHVQGGHFGAGPGSDRRLTLISLVVKEAACPRHGQMEGRQDLFHPNLVAQVMRMLIKVDRDHLGLASDEVPQSIPQAVAALPPDEMRCLFNLLLQSDETDVDLFYIVDGLRMSLTTGPDGKSLTLQEGTDLLLYYMNPTVFTRASDHERARQQEADRREQQEELRLQHFQSKERLDGIGPQRQLEGRRINPHEFVGPSAEKRRPRKPPAKPLETEHSVLLLEHQRQIRMVSSVLEVFHQVLDAGSEASGIDKEKAQAAFAQATADADALIPWLRNEVIRKLSDGGRGTTGPTFEQMETIKFRLTVRIAGLRLLLEAKDQVASCRSLLLLADDVFWMRRTLEKIVTPLSEEDAPKPVNEGTDAWEAVMTDLLTRQIRCLLFDAKPAAVQSFLAALDWVPSKHIYHIAPHLAHRLLRNLLVEGQAGEAAKFFSHWAGLDARGEYKDSRKEAVHELVSMSLPERLVVQLITNAHTRLNLSMTRTLALSFRSHVSRARRTRSLPFILARLQLYRLHWNTVRDVDWTVQYMEAMASFVAGENKFVVSNLEARRRANPNSDLVHRMYRVFLDRAFGKSCVPEGDFPPAVTDDDLVSLFNTALLLREYDDALMCAKHLKDRGASLPTNSIALIFKNFAQSNPDDAAHTLSLLVEGNGEQLAAVMPGLADILPEHIPTVTVATVVDNVFHTLWGLRFFAAASNLAARAAKSQLGIRLNAHAFALIHLAASMDEKEFAQFVRFHMDEGDVQHFTGILIHICRWWLRGHSIREIISSTRAGASEWCAFFFGYPFRELIRPTAWVPRLVPAISIFRTVFLYADTVEYRNCLLLVKRIRQRADVCCDERLRRIWSTQLWKVMGALLMARRGVPYMPIDSQAWQIPHMSTEELQKKSPVRLRGRQGGGMTVVEATDKEVVPTGSVLASQGSSAVLPDTVPTPSRSRLSGWQSNKHGQELQALSWFQLPFVPRPFSPPVEAGDGPFFRDEFVGAFRVPFTVLANAAQGFGLLGDRERMTRTINILHSYGLEPIKTEVQARNLYEFSRLGIPRWDKEKQKLFKDFPKFERQSGSRARASHDP